MTISRPPNFSFAVATSFSQEAASATLAVTVATLWSELVKFFCSAPSFMSAATTLHPSDTNRVVVARPKPDAAPRDERRGQKRVNERAGREGEGQGTKTSEGLAGARVVTVHFAG